MYTKKGFTKRNIERMIQFYSTYKDDEIATPLVTQLFWTNNLLILSGAKSKEERHFYLKLIDKKLLETKLKEMKNLIDNNEK